MSRLTAPPPDSPVEMVTEILHGVEVKDPYRWLEDQDSGRTRAWIERQTNYTRAYLDSIPQREEMRARVRELLDVEAYDSFVLARNRSFFRKRLRGQEQPCLYCRNRASGEDQLLVDPAARLNSIYTAVKPLRASPDGSLLLYEVKQGGERKGVYELLAVQSRRTLPDTLPHGYLRGFAFAPDGQSFYYVHEAEDAKPQHGHAVFYHKLGTDFCQDAMIFDAGEGERLRVGLISGPKTLGILVYRSVDKTLTDFYIMAMEGRACPVPILGNGDYSFQPRLLPGRILAATDEEAPNRRIVDVQSRHPQRPLIFDLIPERDAPIFQWITSANFIVVAYQRSTSREILAFDHLGRCQRKFSSKEGSTVRILAASPFDDEVLLEEESFFSPGNVIRWSVGSGETTIWSRREVPFDSASCASTECCYSSKDGTSISISLIGCKDVLTGSPHPALMTSYGGFGVSTTPQFSVLVAYFLERGCLFALPHIRGGSERGAWWHRAAQRRNRQVAFDDFLAAAHWLIGNGWTRPETLAIFGGSNSGLLVGAAMTQAPALFRAVLSVAPLADMLRYHLFDGNEVHVEEFGIAEDAEDFEVLAGYSPYHAVEDHTTYPATLIVSGDADQNCNALHARKFTARLQAANQGPHPILLDYHPKRGHSPVLPLTVRVDALVDRIAFLSDQLGVNV